MKSVSASISIEVRDGKSRSPDLESTFAELRRRVHKALEDGEEGIFNITLKGCRIIAATNHNDPPRRGEYGYQHRLSFDVAALDVDVEGDET